MLILLLLAAEDLASLKEKFEAEKSKPYAERYQTVAKIGGLKTDEAAEFLIEIFEKDKDESIRSSALTYLGICGTPKAIAKLIAIVKDTAASVSHRSSALSGLGNTKSDEAFDVILAIAKDKDPKNTLRYSALSSLQRWPLDKTEAVFREALTDTNPSVKAQAFRALAPLKDKKVLEAAKRAIDDPQESSYVKSAAVEPWKTAGGVEAVRVLLVAATGDDSTVRRAIQEWFAALKEEKEIEALFEGLLSPTPAVRAIVARALGKLKHDKALDKIEFALKDKEVDVRIAAMDALAERREEKLLQREAQKNDDDATAAAVGALAAFKTDETLKLLLKLAEHRATRIRATALDALGEHKTEAAIPAFKKALDAKEWQVRAAAIRALGKLKTKESVDLLIERMKKEDGRLLVDLGEALKGLTGKAIGYAHGPWKDWWKVNRETFAFPEKTEGVGGGGGGTTYYGVPILSKRIIFCLDISGSMSAKIGAETRLDQAKKELAKVLKALKGDVHVNLIFFDNTIEPWQKSLVPLKSHLPGALKKVEGLSPRGGTNIFDTLEEAFQDPNVDTIYLLSDGAPGSGKIVNTEDILREIKKMNRSRQIVIHTVSLGASPFMKSLAEQNGGQYVEVK